MDKKKTAIKYLCTIVGMGILAFGIYNVHDRCLISEGGVLGAILLIEHWTGISPALSSFVLDVACFIFGAFVLGKGFLKDSLIATTVFSLWYFLFEKTGPLMPNLGKYPIVAAVVGALFVGTGTGLIVINGTACGGDDALALSFNKLFRVPVAAVYFVSDAVVLLLSLSYIPLRSIVYSLLSVMLSSAVISLMMKVYNKHQNKQP